MQNNNNIQFPLGTAPAQKFLDLKVKMAYFRGLCAKFRFLRTITI